MRHCLVQSIAFCLMLLIAPTLASAQSDQVKDTWQKEEYRQFDFWLGTWDVNLRTLQPDQTWADGVQAKAHIHAILDGKAILELWDSPTIKGFSLRHYDPAKQQWVLYLNWPGPSGARTSRLEGAFRHGRGAFVGKQPLPNGGSLISRFTFCDIAEDRLRWDDEYSRDGGKSWTKNWIMEFTRTKAQASWPDEGDAAHTFSQGGRCRGEAFDRLAQIVGRWQVNESEQTGESTSRMRVYHILDGCAVIRFLEIGAGDQKYREFGLLTYHQNTEQYEELVLTNEPNRPALLLRGKYADGQINLAEVNAKDLDRDAATVEWRLPTSSDESIELRVTNLSSTQESTRVLKLGLAKRAVR